MSGSVRACTVMDNRGLVASPEYAAAYFPSGGQGGDHAQTRCPPISVLCTGSARRALFVTDIPDAIAPAARGQ
jgi:hypothetical protein